MKIVLEHLTKKFPARGKKGEEVTAVRDFTFEIPDGSLIGLLGPSGCGKSTALNLLCGLEAPTEGKIYFGDTDVTDMPPELRGVGMVFQNYALYPHLTVRQNILFPLENLKGKQKLSKEEMNRQAEKAAGLVQIQGLMDRKPRELSGGQQQRVGIARALAVDPQIIFADEPTGNLDSKTTMEVLKLMQTIVRERNQTLVMVTHDNNLATYADRIIKIIDGKIVSIEENHKEADLEAAREEGAQKNKDCKEAAREETPQKKMTEEKESGENL